jgi:hypothetical protein
LVFDRGGYSGEAFRFLQAEGIGFITYLKGRSARRRYPAKGFKAGWFAFEGRRHGYKLFEKKTRVRKVGLIRTILFLGEDQQQIPVLTNLAPTAKAAKVVHCLVPPVVQWGLRRDGLVPPVVQWGLRRDGLVPPVVQWGLRRDGLRLRWRQENSFKFLSENYAIDQIIQYGADPETEDRRIPNPKRKALKETARLLTQQIKTLQAQLGRALENNDEKAASHLPQAERSWPEDRSRPSPERHRQKTAIPGPLGEPLAPHAGPDLRSQRGQEALPATGGPPLVGQRHQTGRLQCGADTRFAF